MAENNSGANAQAKPAGNQRGNRSAPNRPPTATMQLNPERAPTLISKWQKLLGKDLDYIEVRYDAEGVSVYLYGKEGTPFHKKDKDGSGASLTIPEYRERKAKETAPNDSDKLNAFRDKFELRLNVAFPANGPSSGSDEAIRQFLNGLPLHQRRAMLMSNKQFKTAYPNGVPQA